MSTQSNGRRGRVTVRGLRSVARKEVLRGGS
jgi:hypothetical protein